MGSELFGLGIKNGEQSGKGFVVLEFSRSSKLCSGLFNQEGPPCDLWAVCSTLLLWMWLLVQGFVVVRQWWAEGSPGLVWARVRAGVRPSPVLCTAWTPEISIPGALTPTAFPSPAF